MKEDCENTGWVLENKHIFLEDLRIGYKSAKSIDTGALERPVLTSEQIGNGHVINLQILLRERAKEGLEPQGCSSQMAPYLKADRAVFVVFSINWTSAPWTWFFVQVKTIWTV